MLTPRIQALVLYTLALSRLELPALPYAKLPPGRATATGDRRIEKYDHISPEEFPYAENLRFIVRAMG
jgi:hypothetical protein